MSHADVDWSDDAQLHRWIAQNEAALGRWFPGIAPLLRPLPVRPLHHPVFATAGLTVNVLCAHELDAQISGNKWFKLKYNLVQARQQGYDCVASFGGAWSNHLHALAAAGHRLGFKTVGIVRGEEHGTTQNAMLDDVRRWGMRVYCVSRSSYRACSAGDQLPTALAGEHAFVIPAGGDNAAGVWGCMTLVPPPVWEQTDRVLLSVGSGCTAAGVRRSLPAKMDMHLYQPFRDARFAERWLQRWRGAGTTALGRCYWHNEWHFGGFGRQSGALLAFIKDFESTTGLPLDPVYTAKMLFGVCQQAQAGVWAPGTRLLIVHSGGLQGRRSLHSLEKNDGNQ